MPAIKERVDSQGKISIAKILQNTAIKPGDFVEIYPDADRIILRKLRRAKKRGGVVKSVAGAWANRPDLVDEALRVRDEWDREYDID